MINKIKEDKHHAEGLLSKEYYTKRQEKSDLKYRLHRRTNEIINSILKFKGKKISELVDIGTCEGAMLKIFQKELDIETTIGIDVSKIGMKNNKRILFVQANCIELPFKEKGFDVLTAAALIEHVSDPKKTMTEFYRILKKGGLCIITTPSPFFEWIATKIGYLEKDEHNETFTLKKLERLFEETGFEIKLAKNFMISPIGFPKEEKIEKFLTKIKLDKLMCNQLIVGAKI